MHLVRDRLAHPKISIILSEIQAISLLPIVSKISVNSILHTINIGILTIKANGLLMAIIIAIATRIQTVNFVVILALNTPSTIPLPSESSINFPLKINLVFALKKCPDRINIILFFEVNPTSWSGATLAIEERLNGKYP